MCLHGYRQNAVKFKSQTGALRKNLRHEAEFFFLSAPHRIPGFESGGEGDDYDQRAWWFTKENSFSSRDVTDLDKGLEESLDLVKKYFDENGPFDALLGFSQGACLVSIICALKQKKQFKPDFKFAIIVSGFKSRCTLHSHYYDEKIHINSLHVIGETDEIISNDMSYDLANVFINAVILKHPGGHYVAGKSNLKDKYINFLQSQKTPTP